MRRHADRARMACMCSPEGGPGGRDMIRRGAVCEAIDFIHNPGSRSAPSTDDWSGGSARPQSTYAARTLNEDILTKGWA